LSLTSPFLARPRYSWTMRATSLREVTNFAFCAAWFSLEEQEAPQRMRGPWAHNIESLTW
jgi:hypothetical protein